MSDLGGDPEAGVSGGGTGSASITGLTCDTGAADAIAGEGSTTFAGGAGVTVQQAESRQTAEGDDGFRWPSSEQQE